MINAQAAQAAVQAHSTVFFDADLNPVVPEPGMWFCEFSDEYTREDATDLRDEAFVKYIGPDPSVAWDNQLGAFGPYGAPMLRHLVWDEIIDDERRPRGVVLIRQS